MKKSIVALSTCILFTTLPSPTKADQLDNLSPDTSVQAEQEWYGISTIEFFNMGLDSGIIEVTQGDIIIGTATFGYYGGTSLTADDIVVSSNLNYVVISNITIDNNSHTGTFDIMVDTSNISSGSETFQLNITDALPENDRHVTPYSITNMIQINEAPEPDPDLTPDPDPTPDPEPTSPSINQNTVNIPKDSVTLNKAIIPNTVENNINTLPETGDNGKTNISFILAGIIMISSA
uniref:LPXTG cell wall anchor domain-containing protein n=1 Tax=Lactococcus lactis subsp. cremoris TaxID=1359 RepID=UPI0024A6246B